MTYKPSTALEDQVARVKLGDRVTAAWIISGVTGWESLNVEAKMTDLLVTQEVLENILDGYYRGDDPDNPNMMYKLLWVLPFIPEPDIIAP